MAVRALWLSREICRKRNYGKFIGKFFGHLSNTLASVDNF
jgi:hypothetical protein